MRPHEKMIRGVGFCFDPSHNNNIPDSIPDYDECRQMVAEKAYEKWEQDGKPPNRDWDYWLQAESELFCGFRRDGYDVYVCNLSLKENQRFFRHWDRVHISPTGIQRI